MHTRPREPERACLGEAPAAWRGGPPAPTAQARAGSVPLSLTPRAVALSATAQLPRMLALCRADGSVVLPLSRQVTGTGSNGRGADVGALAAVRQVTDADGSAAIRTGVQGGHVRSLGRCGVITRAVCLDADTALSYGPSPCELVALCRG